MAHVQEGPTSSNWKRMRLSLNFHLYAFRFFRQTGEHLWMHSGRALHTNRACLNNSLKYYLFGRSCVPCSLFIGINRRRLCCSIRIWENIYFRFTKTDKKKRRARKNEWLRFAASDAVSWKRQSFAATVMPTISRIHRLTDPRVHHSVVFTFAIATTSLSVSNAIKFIHGFACRYLKESSERSEIPLCVAFFPGICLHFFRSFVSAVRWPLVEHFYLHFVSLEMNKKLFACDACNEMEPRTEQLSIATIPFSPTAVSASMVFVQTTVGARRNFDSPGAVRAHRCETFLFWQITKINILLAHEHLCSRFQWVNLINLALGSSIGRAKNWRGLTSAFRNI